MIRTRTEQKIQARWMREDETIPHSTIEFIDTDEYYKNLRNQKLKGDYPGPINL